jgi:hypothetical protein
LSSPSLVPPYTIFPFCECDHNGINSPYWLSQPIVTYGEFSNEYCFKIQQSSYCNVKSNCCNMNIYKIDFAVKNTCYGSVLKTYVNGTRIYPTFDTSFKFHVSDINVNICMVLGKPCNTFSKLCTTNSENCKYAIFNSQQTCCPVRTTYID